jgi:hypothetical protein
MFRVVPTAIIRSANNCIYSVRYLSQRYCYLPLSWKSWKWFECAVGGVLANWFKCAVGGVLANWFECAVGGVLANWFECAVSGVLANWFECAVSGVRIHE